MHTAQQIRRGLCFSLTDHIHSELFFVPYTSPCICDNTRSVNFPYTDIYFLPAPASDQWQQVSDKTDCISLKALFIPQLERQRSLRDSAIGSGQGHSHKANRRISPRTGNRSALSTGSTGLPAVRSRHSNAGLLKAALPLFK